MPFIQRNAAGAIVGLFANLQPGLAEEFLPTDSADLTVHASDQSASEERLWRDAELARQVWLRDRHRDQLELGVVPTLSHEQFSELLVYMQALRDWPQSDAFPDSLERPTVPKFLEAMGGEQ